MKKIVVVYTSKYGHTARYAKFIARSLECDIFKLKEVNEKILLNYDIIIYGGPVHQDMIRGLEKFTLNYTDFENQEFVIFTNGMLSKNDIMIERLKRNNFNEYNKDKFEAFYYFPGGYDYKKLDYGDLLLINYDASPKSKQNYGDKYLKIRRIYLKSFDFVKEDYALDLINYVKELANEEG